MTTLVTVSHVPAKCLVCLGVASVFIVSYILKVSLVTKKSSFKCRGVNFDIFEVLNYGLGFLILV